MVLKALVSLFAVFYLCNVLNGVGANLKDLNHLRYLRE